MSAGPSAVAGGRSGLAAAVMAWFDAVRTTARQRAKPLRCGALHAAFVLVVSGPAAASERAAVVAAASAALVRAAPPAWAGPTASMTIAASAAPLVTSGARSWYRMARDARMSGGLSAWLRADAAFGYLTCLEGLVLVVIRHAGRVVFVMAAGGVAWTGAGCHSRLREWVVSVRRAAGACRLAGRGRGAGPGETVHRAFPSRRCVAPCAQCWPWPIRATIGQMAQLIPVAVARHYARLDHPDG